MTATTTPPRRKPEDLGTVAAALRKYWGYETLRPLQREAIVAGVNQKDSLVVLPTGGGKSLCYQVPPVVADRTDVVVSPLISLMKDQVDALAACGYPAAAVHSGLDEAERRQIGADIAAGKYRLVFVAPERLLTPWFIALLQRAKVGAFAIDEAHCISQWGHDFRPEYRRLAELRQHFPKASIHAFTATATPRVRQDIIDQLHMQRPEVLVGRFDRANLRYRVVPRRDLPAQLLETLARHQGEACIVYCISRKDTEAMAALLREKGIRAAPYHAGLDAATRSKTQEAFAAERLDVVVATVAFGMGIDRSNVRCVIHAAMPKSVEAYQQETGRAGRDGLEAECVLFYAPDDFRRWESLLTRDAAEEQPQESVAAQLGLLEEMQRFCTARVCRHAALSRYFGQEYEAANCEACDVCTTPATFMAASQDVAHKIIGCVLHLGMAFGVGYVVDVLAGSRDARIEQRRHDKLAEYGGLSSLPKETIKAAVFQLVDQGILQRSGGERPVLGVAPAAKDVLDGRREVALVAPEVETAPASSREVSWEGVDRGLFERLRELRREVAAEREVPPFVIFSDVTLREMARLRPSNPDALGRVRGVGERKLADPGPRFLAAINAYCADHALDQDATAQAPLPVHPRPTAAGANAAKRQAFELFEQRCTVDEVVAATGRARSTIGGYLADYVVERQPDSVETWVTPEVYRRVATIAARVGAIFLKPVFEALNGEVPYDEIRVVVRHAGLT